MGTVVIKNYYFALAQQALQKIDDLFKTSANLQQSLSETIKKYESKKAYRFFLEQVDLAQKVIVNLNELETKFNNLVNDKNISAEEKTELIKKFETQTKAQISTQKQYQNIISTWTIQ